MTESQQIEFNKLKSKVDETSLNVIEVHRKTDVIYYALVGNDLSKDGGLVQQIKNMEEREKKFEEKRIIYETKIEARIAKLESAFTRWKGIVYGVGISGAVIGFLLKVIIDSYLKK